MVTVDKRLELLEALVLSVKLNNKNDACLNEDLDFVEYYDIAYVKDLVKQIHIEKYPQMIDYIKDIADCGYYTNLFLFFDDCFNMNQDLEFEPFETKKVFEFAKMVKTIYEDEKIYEVFSKYEVYLNNLTKQFENIYDIKFEDNLSKMYENVDNIQFSTVISLLINGGFSSKKDNTVSYVKGIKVENDRIVFNEYTVVCLYHEYSHFFVNKIIDKYEDKINNIDILYNEAIQNGLPKPYQNKKTLLYEYFVRANSIILSENQISMEEYI